MLLVEELRDLLVDDRIVLIAGEEGLDKYIDFINIQEIAQKSSWIKKNGFIMTTFNDFENTKKIVDQLHWYNQMEVSGIGFHTAKHGSVPEEVKTYADHIDLPLFKIPHDIPYYHIYDRVNRHLHKQSEELKAQIDKVNESMLNAVLLNKESHQIIHMMGDFLKVPVVYLNERLQTNALWSDKNYSRSDLNNALSNMVENEPELFKQSKVNNNDQESGLYQIGKNNLSFTILPLMNDIDFFGFLLVAIPKKRYLQYEVVIKHGVTALLLDAMKKNATKQFYKSQDIRLFEEIFQGNNNAGLDLNTLHFPVRKLKQLFIAESHKVHQIKQQFLQLEEVIFARGDEHLMWISNNQIIGMLTKPVTEQMIKFASKKLNNITIGFSDSLDEVTNSSHIRKLFEQATHSVKYAKINDLSIMRWQELEFNKIIYSLNEENFLFNYDEETLQPILEYDRNHDAELNETLYVYLKCFFSFKESSKILHVHPNTVKYRIEKIKELMPYIDFSNPECYLSLMFALKLQNYKCKSGLS